MENDHINVVDEDFSQIEEYQVFESLQDPVCIIDVKGILSFANAAFKKFLGNSDEDLGLDWKHPLFPEYRRRVAKAYLSAMNGSEKQCFAVINLSDDVQLPVEIFLFPMYKDDAVSAILVFLKIVDNRLLSFDRSTLSLISEENFQYDKLHMEFSPLPILRIDQEKEVVKWSPSFESFLGYTSQELIKKNSLKEIFSCNFEKFNRALTDIITGNDSYKRLGEFKINTKDKEGKIINLVIYPIIQNNEISSVEIIIEDISKITELKEKINSLNRNLLLKDITKGFLHSLNNSINVIMSMTQMLSHITEKETVVEEGIHLIENSALDIVDQIRRVQNFISNKKNNDSGDEEIGSLVDVIEDAIEFSKMQFKVEDNENNRSIHIEKKYFCRVDVNIDISLFRELIISMILKVSSFVQRKGIIDVILKKNSDISLSVSVDKNIEEDIISSDPNLGLDIRQVAEKLKLKLFEEESSDKFTIKAIFPKKMIIEMQKKESPEVEFKLRDLDIIIVEDEIALQKILFEIFDRMGNRVFICEKGEEALEEFKRKDYDLLITDYGIPGITGIELAVRIKELKEDTVTILLSGWMLDDIQIYENIIDLFLPKPFKLDDLVRKISNVFIEKNKNKKSKSLTKD